MKKKFNRFMLACAVIAGFSVAYPLAEWGGPVLSMLDQVAPWVAVNLVLASICSVLLRSEEHTSELQSRGQLVCRLLLEKKNETVTSASTPAVLPRLTVQRATGHEPWVHRRSCRQPGEVISGAQAFVTQPDVMSRALLPV